MLLWSPIVPSGTTAAKRSTTTTTAKPDKPYPDFPLTAHPSGQWCKKIRGKIHYFGVWADPDAALALYLDQRDDLQAGRKPRASREGLTIMELGNRFMVAKRDLLNAGEITDRTFRDYYQTCDRMLKLFGKQRLVEDLDTDDFAQARATMSKTLGPVALGNEINRIRGVFKFADDHGLIERRVRYGSSFKRPSARVLRKHRNTQKQKRGYRMFESEELQKLIEAAPQPLKTFILLAINGGLGQSDIASIPRTAIDLDAGWIDFPRPKTGVDRRFPLWPETCEAIQEALKKQREPKHEADAGLAFVTKFGERYVRLAKAPEDLACKECGTPSRIPDIGEKLKCQQCGDDIPTPSRAWTDAIGQEFNKLLKAQKLKRNGVGFYAIRHTLETIAGGLKDQPAVDAVMGHVDSSMAGVYRERIDDERLKSLTDHVRTWLFPEE